MAFSFFVSNLYCVFVFRIKSVLNVFFCCLCPCLLPTQYNCTQEEKKDRPTATDDAAPVHTSSVALGAAPVIGGKPASLRSELDHSLHSSPVSNISCFHLLGSHHVSGRGDLLSSGGPLSITLAMECSQFIFKL